MSIILLFLSWYLLYLVFRYIFDIGSLDKGTSLGETDQNEHSQNRSDYLNDVPDALRPDIDFDEFDPTDWI